MFDLPDDHPAILRIKELETGNSPAGSHHGAPDLTEHDIDLLEAHKLWVETSTKENNGNGWLPGYPDWIKSRLFWRIRSGQKPLKYPPPTCFSCPWYELIEMPKIAHSTAEPIRIYDFDGSGTKKYVSVAQCRYHLVSGSDNFTKENPLIISYGNYRFKAWNDLVEWTGINPEDSYKKMGGYIQFDGEIE